MNAMGEKQGVYDVRFSAASVLGEGAIARVHRMQFFPASIHRWINGSN
ncbi:MAG: hypothetical protein IPK83_18835 [Planctomycetes bacterium]|nr:hypothetical protein [Planctomycetota bacterium]